MCFVAVSCETVYLLASGYIPLHSLTFCSVSRLFGAGIFTYMTIGSAILIHISLGKVTLRIFRLFSIPGFSGTSPGPVAWITASPPVSLFIYLFSDQLNRIFLQGFSPSDLPSLAVLAVAVTLWISVLPFSAMLFRAISTTGPVRRIAESLKEKQYRLSGLSIILILGISTVAGFFAGYETDHTRKAGTVLQDSDRDTSFTTYDNTEAFTIVLISIETLRADRLNCLGYSENITSPNMDRLASEGYLFTSCRAQAPWTKPSVASLMTSLYPCGHGQNGYGSEVEPSLVTLPDVLNRGGFKTASFTTIRGAADSNFGFREDHYLDFGPPPVPWPSLLDPGPFHAGKIIKELVEGKYRLYFPSSVLTWYNDAERVTGTVLDWLDNENSEKIFCHIHFIDPHTPYLTHPYKSADWNFRSRWNMENIKKKYDGEILYTDRAVGRIAANLQERSGRFLLVIVGDHGEEFYERSGWGHGYSLFDEMLHVPLIFWMGGIDPGNKASSIETPVSVVDTAPTILKLAGIDDIPREWDGISLVPLLDGASPSSGKRIPVAHLQSRGRIGHSFISEGIKVVLFQEGNGVANDTDLAFDLESDPLEKSNLLDYPGKTDGALTGRLAQAMTDADSILAVLAKRNPTTIRRDLSPRDIENLKALGYLH